MIEKIKVIIKEEVLREASIHQLRQQFVDSGKISSEDFEEIANTTQKSAHVTWLVKMVVNEIIKQEDVYKWKEYFSIFDKHKNKYPYSDINRYKTEQDVHDFIKTSTDIGEEIKQDPSKQKAVSKFDKYKEFYIGDVDGFKVFEIPQGRRDLYGVSCELGSGTEWCTATGKTRSYFDEYIMDDSLFIFINRSTKEKYQFNYARNEFMDKYDTPII